MIRPNGTDSLAVRERYLRQQRRNVGSRFWTAGWVAGAALLGWLFIGLFSGIPH